MKHLASQQIIFDLKHGHAHDIPVSALPETLKNKNELLWIHCDLTDEAHFNHLMDVLAIEKNDVDLIKKNSKMSQLKDNIHSLMMRFQCVSSIDKTNHGKIKFTTVSVYLTDRYCLTVSNGPVHALDLLKSTYEKEIKYAKTPCFILFLLLDHAVNDFARVLFEYELKADKLDIKIRSMHENLYEEVMNLKKDMMHTKRYAAILRDLLMRTSGKKISVVSDDCRASLIDLFNHAQVLAIESESIRELLNGLLDQIDNSLMQKMNGSIKVLTAFAAIFLPLTLVTGIYGMNFRWIPELNWQYGYFYALGLLVAIACMMFIFFKKSKWF